MFQLYLDGAFIQAYVVALVFNGVRQLETYFELRPAADLLESVAQDVDEIVDGGSILKLPNLDEPDCRT